MITIQENKGPGRAILAGLNTKKSKEEYDISMRELAGLAKALDLEVVSVMVQNTPSVSKKTLIGSGKVQELLLEIDITDADIVIFNETLSPMQVKNLEDALDTEVLDRTGIILQIFSQRAATNEARLQGESARLQYMLPRLVGMRKNLSRQGGGSGRLSNKGAGEEKLELDRRHIEQQLKEVNRKLKSVEKERSTQRSRRMKTDIPRVCLVGYTNAGKSTLMNALLSRYGANRSAGKKVFEKDMLFATLDTSTRKIAPPGMPPFLLSDTVGFISGLPHSLVKAFRSTLEEAVYADLLLEVIDYSDPSCEEQVRVTAATLEEIGAGHIPVLYVYNKADLAEDIRIPQVHDDRIYLSAKDGRGIPELLHEIGRLTAL